MILPRIIDGVIAALLVGSCAVTTTSAFTTPTAPLASVGGRPLFAASRTALAASSSPDLVVISPPGGIGEIASVEAARLGGSVKWFVVSAPSSGAAAAAASAGTNVALTAETLAAISASGGSLDLAGATSDSLLAPPDDESNSGALSAMASWCGSSKSIICTYDGAVEEKKRVDRIKTPEQKESGYEDEVESIRSGIRVAAREASRGAGRGGNKIALLAAGEEMTAADGEEGEKKGGFLAGLFGGNAMEVPDSLAEAMEGTSVIRYGELFGAPESSPESSPFMGGPRRDPTVREMYTMRSARIDPTVSGGDMGSKSNRLAVGEAASRLGLGKVTATVGKGTDVSLSSFAGTESPTLEEWNAEFKRATEMASSSAGGARLFAAEFSSVPSTKRLAEWIATKWAPAIMRSYDIAGTRVGARAVVALQTADDTVEILWQDMVDFQSVTSGKMIIEVGENGMTAKRGAGDASKGFGGISSKPLPGEDILVRRLGDAASQAVEKGLAVKPQVAKKAAPEKKTVTTVVATTTPPAQPAAAAESSGPGPRGAGARRSSERSRGSGKRRRTTPPPSSSE